MRKSAAAVAFAAGALLLSSCANTLSVSTSADTSRKPEQPTRNVATSNIDAKKTLPAGKRVEILANDQWVIESVSINDSAGTSEADLAAPTSRWRSEPLGPSQQVTYTATLRDQQTGETQTISRTVQSGGAKNTFAATMFPKSGTFGIGVMPTVTFDQFVPERDRAAIAERLKVESSPTQVAGAWRWEDGDTAVFRPRNFWPARTSVRVVADLENAVIRGAKPRENSYGSSNTTAAFKTDNGITIKVNAPKKRGRVVVDGKTIRKFPTSVGKAGYVTRSGVKTITDKFKVTRMTNIGVTDDEVYDLQVPYAMRITNSGEFLHGAPWNGNIGYANTSHGCTNATLSDAKWIFKRVHWGTPVVTKGTGRAMENWNGPGARWNIKYGAWNNS